MFSKNFNKLIFNDNDSRAGYIAFITSIFAIFYHFGYLVTFAFLNVMEMAYFNIGSVILFSIILFYSRKNLGVSFILSYFEVIFHQVLADYFIGFTCSFHFLLLIIGFIPFLIFNRKIGRSIFLSFLAILIFILMYANESFFTGIYTITPTETTIIKIVNISLSILVILFQIILFTQIVINNENNLTNEIARTKKELNEQSHKVIELQNNTIIRLANLVENRDSDTGLHVKRTSIYVKLIAERAKEKNLFPEINKKFISLIYNAAPMHDIGKIVVSDVILKKPGKLSPEEFDQMKLHTTEGKRIIEEILFDQNDKDYLRTAKEIAGSHHEKWDGTGYPNNLKENEIPLSARIMAIADVYDALVSPRCYKEPFPVDKAFQIIEEGIGTHFDPVLGKLFVEMKEEIVSLKF